MYICLGIVVALFLYWLFAPPPVEEVILLIPSSEWDN